MKNKRHVDEGSRHGRRLAVVTLAALAMVIWVSSPAWAGTEVTILLNKETGQCVASDMEIHLAKGDTVEFTNGLDQALTLEFDPAGATEPGSPVKIAAGKSATVTITGPGDTSTADEAISYTIASEACPEGAGPSSPRILIDPGGAR
jgi:hypothetical protein